VSAESPVRAGEAEDLELPKRISGMLDMIGALDDDGSREED
jgi:hypothetical protein